MYVTVKVESSLLQALPASPRHSTQSTHLLPYLGLEVVFLHGSWKGPFVDPVLELLTLQPVLMQTEEDTNHTEGAVAPLL